MWQTLTDLLRNLWSEPASLLSGALVVTLGLLHVTLWRMSRPTKSPPGARSDSMTHIGLILAFIFCWILSEALDASPFSIYAIPFLFLMAALLFSVIAATLTRDLGSAIQALAYVGVLGGLLAGRFFAAEFGHIADSPKIFLYIVAIGAVHVLIIKAIALAPWTQRAQRAPRGKLSRFFDSMVNRLLFAMGLTGFILFLIQVYSSDLIIMNVAILITNACLWLIIFPLNPYAAVAIPARGLGWLPLVFLHGAIATVFMNETSLSNLYLLVLLLYVAGLWLPAFRSLGEYLDVPPLPRYPRRSRSGVTLIELLISIALISISVFTFNQLATFAMNAADGQNQWRQAITLAEDQMALLRARDAPLAPGEYAVDPALADHPLAPVARVMVAPADPPGDGLVEARVLISLDQLHARSVVQITTLLAPSPNREGNDHE